MSMHNLIEYSDNYSKTSGFLWQNCRDQLIVDNNGSMADFTVANYITDSFNIKEKQISQAGCNDTKNVELLVPLKYLSNFWRTLEMILINGEINLDWFENWSKKCLTGLLM